MKRIGFTEKELEVLENALVQYGAVINFDQLYDLFNEDRAYLRKRISKLNEQGWLIRIKKGIYVISDLSSRGSLPISHNSIVNLLVENAYISFESALQYHGWYDQLLTKINLVSLKQNKDTVIDGYTYTFVKTQSKYFYGWRSHQIDGQTVKIADREKALIDLIQFHRNRYSVDLVLEKLLTYKDDLDLNHLNELLSRTTIAVQRIMGFLLECARLNSEKLWLSLEDKKGVTKISNSKNNIYNNKWKLYYDQYFDRYARNSTNKKSTGTD
jgi:predicted transcriptional regulator of viral defense system